MFFNYQDLKSGSLSPERQALAERIAAGLPKAEVIGTERRNVRLRLPDDTVIEGDVTASGLTVYLGGFDWVTFETPPRILQQFPQFLPLPQQVMAPSSDGL